MGDLGSKFACCRQHNFFGLTIFLTMCRQARHSILWNFCLVKLCFCVSPQAGETENAVEFLFYMGGALNRIVFAF